MILDPLPQVLCLNINWYDQTVPYLDTLRFCASIPQRFTLNDLFDFRINPHTTNKPEEYILKSVVCFFGRHYMTYIKKKSSSGVPLWKLYDDSNKVIRYETWNIVLSNILEL